MNPKEPVRSRLAPSPTGSLHLGNARTFLVNWLLVRRAGGTLVLRIEDLDRARAKPALVDDAIANLAWLGLDWDEGPVFQSERIARYEAAFARLQGARLVYPCTCSRKEVAAAASAPHESDEGTRYPGTCRGRWRSEEDARAARGRPPCWRFAVPATQAPVAPPAPPANGHVPFQDRFLGRVARDPASDGGDFVVRSFDGTFAYQLAVVVDDAEMGITEVVRGDDLVASTPRQILLYRALGARPPAFTHLPLVVDEQGERLAKRRGDLDLTTLRARGVAAGAVVAWLARSCGMADVGERVAAADLVGRFDLARLPRERVVVRELPW